jgi:lipid-A-disaccharide synthase
VRGSTVRIGIVAGEPSGDSLGAGLINAVKRIYPDAEFIGVGGPKMSKAGCDTLYDMDRIGLMGLEGVFEKLGDILKIRSSLYRTFVANPPDLFIGIDVPDFNLALEHKLKKKNIKTVHYVSPTVWAWRGYRIHKIRRAVNHMLTLFPFEADYYKSHNIPVTCVGHPIADEIDHPDTMAARNKIGIAVTEGKLVIGLLPGSRDSEVKRLAALFVEVVTKINQANSSIHFVLPFGLPISLYLPPAPLRWKLRCCISPTLLYTS